MKDFLKLEDDDQLVGVLYIGCADMNPEGSRIIPLGEKFTWIR